jgi:hypothetical protein
LVSWKHSKFVKNCFSHQITKHVNQTLIVYTSHDQTFSWNIFRNKLNVFAVDFNKVSLEFLWLDRVSRVAPRIFSNLLCVSMTQFEHHCTKHSNLINVSDRKPNCGTKHIWLYRKKVPQIEVRHYSPPCQKLKVFHKSKCKHLMMTQMKYACTSCECQ